MATPRSRGNSDPTQTLAALAASVLQRSASQTSPVGRGQDAARPRPATSEPIQGVVPAGTPPITANPPTHLDPNKPSHQNQLHREGWGYVFDRDQRESVPSSSVLEFSTGNRKPLWRLSQTDLATAPAGEYTLPSGDKVNLSTQQIDALFRVSEEVARGQGGGKAFSEKKAIRSWAAGAPGTVELKGQGKSFRVPETELQQILSDAGGSAPEKARTYNRAERLTEEQYNALSEEEQAAVDFNTQLLRQADGSARLQEALASGDDSAYTKLANEIFNSQQYRMNAGTSQVLNVLGGDFRTGGVQDGIRSGIAAEDLGRLRGTLSVPGQDAERLLSSRDLDSHKAIRRMQQVRSQLDQEKLSLQGVGTMDLRQFSNTSQKINAYFTSAQGVDPRFNSMNLSEADRISQTLGFGGGGDIDPVEEANADLFELVARAENQGTWTADEVWESLRRNGIDAASFREYVARRINGYNESRRTTGLGSLGRDSAAEYIDPEMLLKQLGLR